MMPKTRMPSGASGLAATGRLLGAIKAAPPKCLRILPAFLLVLCAPVWAETASTQRSVKGPAGQDIRIGVYATIRPDCKSGPPPTIRLTVPPTHGQVTVKQGKLKATNLRQCLVTEVPAFVVIYKSKPEFSGDDALTLEVVNADGKTQIQIVTVNVGPHAPGQKI